MATECRLYHSNTKIGVPYYTGFSWGCFFFGAWWFLSKGMRVWTVVALGISIGGMLLASVFNIVYPSLLTGVCTFLFGLAIPLCFGVMGNDMYYKHLRKKGYATKAEMEEGESNGTLSGSPA